jgi:hypothetical protein
LQGPVSATRSDKFGHSNEALPEGACFFLEQLDSGPLSLFVLERKRNDVMVLETKVNNAPGN